MLATWLGLEGTGAIMISLAVIWAAGFLVTRITKLLHMPNVTGYILAGVLLGPYLLHVIPDTIVSGMDFVTDAALCFISFGVGRYLRFDTLRDSGRGIILLTICEALIAAALIALAMYYLCGMPIAFCLLLGAIGSATAPASSLMLMRRYGAKGNFSDVLTQVVALDDAVALISFTVCVALIEAAGHGGDGPWMVALFSILRNLLAVALGVGLGLLLNRLINKSRSKDHRLVLACAAIFGLAGICATLGVSPLLAVMIMGAVYANSHHDKALFKQISRVSPPVLLMFYVLSGMKLNLPVLVGVWMPALVYLLARIVGKMLGANIGGIIGRMNDKIRRYLGIALLPQAGVSIGLAMLAVRLLPQDQGQALLSIILGTSIVYEMISPLGSKLALALSRNIKAFSKGVQLAEKWENREYLGKDEDWVYVAGQDGPVVSRASDWEKPGEKAKPSALAQEYLDSLNEVDRPHIDDEDKISLFRGKTLE